MAGIGPPFSLMFPAPQQEPQKGSDVIREVYLIHHSHTDIGYTHSQPVVLELHQRFIELALDAAEATADWPDECRFKWTCEVTGITVPWWRQACADQRERFLAAVRRGQFEVAGLQWNLTPLVDDRMLLKLLEPVHFLRDQGIPIRSAMNSDVNGAPWGLVDALLDYGIENFSMGVNEHYGYAPQPRPRGFWWESPTGRKLLVWNGLQYWNAANIQMRIPESIEAVADAMPKFLKVWEDRGYPYTFLPVQVTTASAPDNAAPDPGLPGFVRDWNATSPDVRLKMVTLTEMFERLRLEEEIPSLRGDWTDWWNFGSGSTARETTLALEGQRMLGVAEQLQAWPGVSFPRQSAQIDQSQQDLALYTEHTWGSDRSVHIPDSPETAAQLSLKTGYAYRGFLTARMLRRDGLERVAQFAGGDELSALVYNPLPYPVRRWVRLPRAGSEFAYLSEPRLHHHHRQDVAFGDQLYAESAKDRFQWHGPFDLPALGYITVPLASEPEVLDGLSATEDGLGNGTLQMRFAKDRAGIESLTLDGVTYATGGTEFQFCEPVLEQPRGGTRGELFGPLDWRALDVHQQWKPEWDAARSGPVHSVESQHGIDGNCASYTQTAEMANGDRFELTYRLFPGARSVDLSVTLIKTAMTAPHGLYLAMPLDLNAQEMACHYSTAGAVVELDREQIPYSSKHYITTQNFIRLQDQERGVTVACPDAPLWQVGGFTFGCHELGEVKRETPMLNVWLTNNYWDVNFAAAQSGALRFRFQIIPHAAQAVDESAREALRHLADPQVHIFRNRGSATHAGAQLLDVALGSVIMTQLEGVDSGLTLTLLNPADASQPVSIGSGIFHVDGADLENLASFVSMPLALDEGRAAFDIEPRAWIKVHLKGSVKMCRDKEL